MSRLIKDTSLYSIGIILPKLAGFVLLPIYTSFLSVEEYGIVSAMVVFNAFFSIFITLNIERSIFRLYYDYEKISQKKEYIGTVFTSTLIYSTIILATSFYFHDYISLIFTSIDFDPYFKISISTVYVGIFGSILRVILQVTQKVKLFVILGIAQFGITCSATALFVVYYEQGAYGYLKGGLLGNVFTAPIFIKLLLPHLNLSLNKEIIVRTLKYSLPIVPAVLCAQIVDLSDRIFIEKYLSTAQLGLYSLGYTIAGVVLVFTGSFKKAYDPFFYKIANSSSKKRAVKILKRTNELYYLATIFICFSISLVSKEIVYWLFPSSYTMAYKIIPIISLGYAVSRIAGLLNLSFYQEKKTLELMKLSIYTAALNIGLNFILIPLYGYYGAGIATLLTFIFMLVVKYNFTKKCFFLPINWIMLFSFTLLFSSIYLFFEYIVELENGYSFCLKCSLLLGILTMGAWCKRGQVKQMFRNE